MPNPPLLPKLPTAKLLLKPKVPTMFSTRDPSIWVSRMQTIEGASCLVKPRSPRTDAGLPAPRQFQHNRVIVLGATPAGARQNAHQGFCSVHYSSHCFCRWLSRRFCSSLVPASQMGLLESQVAAEAVAVLMILEQPAS